MEYDTTVKHGRRSTSRLLIPSSQIKFSESQSQRAHLATTRGNLAENPTSTSILGSNVKTNTLSDTTGTIRTSEVTSSPLRQIYSAVNAAYDMYIQAMDFPSASQELRTGSMIERYRIDLWRRRVLAEDEIEQGNLPTYDIGLWALFESILTKMLETFSENHHTMDKYGPHNSITRQESLSGVVQFASLQPVEHSHEGSELLETMSIATKSPPEHSLTKLRKTLPYALLERKHLEQLLQTLCYWNDSLDGLTSTLERESSRRRLRAHFSTSKTAELQNLKAAVAFLKHQDIERMANARSVIEQGKYGDLWDLSQLQSPDNLLSTPLPEYRLEADELEWQEVPYQTDKPHQMATLRGESVIVDWQNCHDDRWRLSPPATFRRRTPNLITILNTGLRPLNLSVFHCVGYLERDSNKTGYAFRLPPGAGPGQMPVTLHHLLRNARKSDDIPDVGERFQLAKALALTVFEIHNLGWLHKNIQPKNILFWPKPNSEAKVDISKPYLMGFDISRPNQPREYLKKPLSDPGDDIYRHPLYKRGMLRAFQPSFDMYSLGIVLYEIGLWRCITVASGAAFGISKPRLIPAYNFGSLYIDNLLYIDDLLKDSSVDELKSFMGKKYGDAVIACLKREFDDVWEKREGDREKQLHTYLDQVQNKILDAISVCSA